MHPIELFGAVLRQWGVAAPFDRRHAGAAHAEVSKVAGSGRLTVCGPDGTQMSVPYPRMLDAADEVLRVIAVTHAIGDDKLFNLITPAMFQWSFDKPDVTSTADADAVIAKLKESMQ